MTGLNDPRRAAAPTRDILIRAAQAAGQAALMFYRRGETTTAGISNKGNNSPVTEADYAADAAIRAILGKELPDAAIFSEEASEAPERHHQPLVAVVDPIDGTRAFIQGRDEWCISLALMLEGVPVAGVIHAPARGETYAAVAGHGATFNGRPLPLRKMAGSSPLRISGPNRLVDTLTEHWPPLSDGDTLRALAYRFVSVAAGQHDIAVATLGAHDWDIAAAEVILAETGCMITGFNGMRPVYNAAKPVHPALIAGEARTVDRLVAALAQVEIRA